MKTLNNTISYFIAMMLMQEASQYPWMIQTEMQRKVADNLGLRDALLDKDKLMTIKALRTLFQDYKDLDSEIKLVFPQTYLDHGKHTAFVYRNYGPWDIYTKPRLGLREAKDIADVLFAEENINNLFL